MIGSKIGSYEVVAKLGEGGMGQVYRARDLKLGRDVALKILPAAFVQDAERLARFEREAHVLASISHPNIATIHGFEESGPALVLELVEGPTLADRIAGGSLPVTDALAIARQIADALDAAHEQGIIHRDLKPANVKVRDDGTVKVLDFGLAKALDPVATSGHKLHGSGSDPQDIAPTITSPAMTQQGVVLGTAAYMSPEQARGRRVDRRTDIWALGVVLFEMLSGTTVFAGDTVTDVLASVVTRDPDWTRLPPATPTSIQRLLRRCLDKDPKRRLRDAADLRLEIEDALASPSGSGSAIAEASGRERSRWLLPAAIGGALLAGVAIGLVVNRRSVTTEPSLLPVAVLAPAATSHVVLSPNGEWMAAVSRDGPVYVRRMKEAAWRGLQGVSTDGMNVFWSADSRQLGFASATALKRIDLVGSRAQTICDPCIAPGSLRGASWNRAGEILFSAAWAGSSGGLKKVLETGGAVSPVTSLDQARGENSHRYPWFLPDGRRFFFTVRRASGEHEIMWASLDGDAPRRVVSGFSAMAYAAGHLLFARDQVLLALAVDSTTGVASGDPVKMVDRVQHHPAIGHAYFSVSEDGTLVFTRAPDAEGLRYFDRSGAVAATLTDLRSADVPRVSPDGTRVLTATFDAEKGSTDIYVVASDTGARTRLTSDPNWEEHPVWSPDSRRVAYRGSKGRPGLYVQNATGSDEQLLIEEAAADRLDPMDWSHDGQLLVNRWSPEAAEDLVLVPLEGSPTIRPWLATKSREFGGRFSPDGRLVAYTSNETGTNEIHIRAFADPAVTRRVTTSGGEHPIWSRDGRELFYLGPGGWVTAVPIRTAPVLEVGNPVRLFRRAGGGFSLEFDVDRSGRFLMSVIDNSMETSAFNVFHLVLNWPLLLKPRQ